MSDKLDGEQSFGNAFDFSDTRAALDIVKRATAVERQRCLDEIESLAHTYPVGGYPHDDVARSVLIDIGVIIAGGDAGPHSDEALAWRLRVTGDDVEKVTP